MRIGVIGGGVVGSATARAFAGHVEEVRVYDKDPKRATATVQESLDADLIFVCLPTPQKAGSLECDTSALDQFFTALETPSPAHKTRNANFVLKSTVPIGYTRKARDKYGLPNLVHSPEFLTARTANLDAAMPVRNIIGDSADRGFSSACGMELRKLYERRWPHVPVHYLTSDESEAVKLFQNSFSAVKIVAFNEFRALADKLGMDWERVRGALLAGGWIHPLHTQCPGPDGKRGFGGACLPKDLANLLECADARYVQDEYGDPSCVSVLMAAHDRNRLVDRKEFV